MHQPCPDESHEWGPHHTFRDKDFGVAFGSIRTCKKCGWHEYEDRCANRVIPAYTLLSPDKWNRSNDQEIL